MSGAKHSKHVRNTVEGSRDDLSIAHVTRLSENNETQVGKQVNLQRFTMVSFNHGELESFIGLGQLVSKRRGKRLSAASAHVF